MKKITLRVAGAGLLLFLAILFLLYRNAQAQDAQRIRDVIYEKTGGVALTMDVFKPAKPNGIGVIWIVSGGWFSDHTGINPGLAQPFTSRNQTVFEVVHGSQPRYTIGEIVPQLQRAVRFIRTHASEYGVDPNKLGIAGGSAGGHLSLMIASKATPGKPGDSDPVERASSGVQAAAVFFPPTDFMNYGETGRILLLTDVLNDKFKIFAPAFPVTAQTSAEDRKRIARETSPIYSVTDKMPPTLIIHGDADDLVPIQQSQLFIDRLKELKVPNELIVRKGKGHGWPEMGEDFPSLADWFDKYLGNEKKSQSSK